MYVTLPAVFGIVAPAYIVLFWMIIDRQWLIGRIDDVDDTLDRHRGNSDKRHGNSEDWIRHLDERTRRMDGAVPRDDTPTQEQARVLIGHWGGDIDPGVIGPVEAWPREDTYGRHAAQTTDSEGKVA